MFSKLSRYRNLADIVVIDEVGVVRESRVHRRLPKVRARFQHTLNEIDRPDQLAFKYHGQSRNWWRICDANPEFKSPRDLFGNASHENTQFTLQFLGVIAPWNEMFVAVGNRLGVLSIEKGTSSQRLPAMEVSDDTVLFNIPAILAAELPASTYRQELTPPLATALAGGGLSIGANASLTQASVSRWLLTDLDSGETYSLLEVSGAVAINVSSTVLRHSWSMAVRSSPENVTRGEIRAQIASFGFDVDAPQAMTRVGRPIVIPPSNS